MNIECALLPYFTLSFAILLDADLELLGKGRGDCHVICSYLGDISVAVLNDCI